MLSALVSRQRPPHTVWPEGQAQRPDSQLCPVTQAVPHAPQLVVSVCTFTQTMRPPVVQMRLGAAQVSAQVPEAQSWPVGQALAQAPQLALSLDTSTQRPPHTV